MANVTINNSANGVQEAILSVSQLNTDEVSITIVTLSGNPYTIDWGDGVVESSLVSNVVQNHTYVGDATQIKISADDGLEDIQGIINNNANFLKFTGSLTEFNQFTNLVSLRDKGAGLTGTLDQFPKSLVNIQLSNNSGTYPTITGNVINLPPVLSYFYLANNNTSDITGNLNDFPKSVTSVFISKSTLTGDVSTLPPNLLSFYLENNIANITGNILNIPRTVTIWSTVSYNTLTGNIANLPPNITFFQVTGGSNTLYGLLQDIPSSLGTLKVDGFNIIEGDFSNVEASGLVNLRLEGYNTISGDIGDVTKSWTIVVKGNNTISGDIADLSSPYTLIDGNNTITGSLHNITIDFHYLRVKGNNTIQNLGTKDYSIVLGSIQIDLRYDASLGSGTIGAQVDQLIIDLDAAGLDNEVILQLENGDRTAASNAAHAAITGGGGYIIIT